MINSDIMSFINKYAPELSRRIRPLSNSEQDNLVRQGNIAESWDMIVVLDGFKADFILGNRFFGFVIIGATGKKNTCKDGFSLTSGIYNSTIGNCVIKDHVTINSLLFCNFYKIENSVAIHNIGELFTTESARFGNGTQINSHHQIDLINENGGRAVLPFEGMTSSDAYLWAKYRDDHELQDRLIEITKISNALLVNTIGSIENNAIIKNCAKIRNCNIGESALIHECTLIDNVTIRSTKSEQTAIGADVQLKNSIIGFNNHIDSGTQLSSVITGSSVSIHQTARITHSFIGDNSSIGCCEITNSLIFPSHAQHHNNSFLIATMIGGQSNIAAGATIGSNHNSRTNDGEIWAARGFWPGLCTSFKHNSRFASYCLSAKADYPSELDIPFPFSLIVNDSETNALVIIPAFYFIHNMYSFIRNRVKFVNRDKRIIREQNTEHNPLAPDTIEEIFNAIAILEQTAGKQWYSINNQDYHKAKADYQAKGKELFNTDSDLPDFEIRRQFEKSNRLSLIKEPSLAWRSYRSIVYWYAASTIVEHALKNGLSIPEKPLPVRNLHWVNCGGQIVSKDDLHFVIMKIKSDHDIQNWESIHAIFNDINNRYRYDKYIHALGCMASLEGFDMSSFSLSHIKSALHNSISSCKEIPELTKKSRSKDFSDHFRSIVYSSKEEMNAVLGTFENDSIISQIENEISILISTIEKLIR